MWTMKAHQRRLLEVQRRTIEHLQGSNEALRSIEAAQVRTIESQERTITILETRLDRMERINESQQ